MTTEESTKTILSVEELTLFSLDQSQTGLDELITQCIECSDFGTAQKFKINIPLLLSFTDALYTLDGFEHNIAALFSIDRSALKDSEGNLESNVLKFRSSLQELSEHLEKKDFRSASLLLNGDLKHSLIRFKALFLILRTYIDKEYLDSANAA